MAWQNIDSIYQPPKNMITKGTKLFIKVLVTGDFSKFEENPIGIKSLVTYWSYPSGDKDIKPYKLLSYSSDSNSFALQLLVLRKAKDTDELKLLFQDILHVLNHEQIQIIAWDVSTENSGQ